MAHAARTFRRVPVPSRFLAERRRCITVLRAGLTEKQRMIAVITALAVSLLLPSILQGQATISTGNVNGTVVDPSGAAVPGAKVTITHIDTGVTTNVTTNSSGFYNSGSIAPGKYLVKVEAKGFDTSEEQVNVRIANNTAVNFNLKVGQESTAVRVDASAVSVNTETTSVEGVLTASQIDSLPVNGRNFLDLAQLEEIAPVDRQAVDLAGSKHAFHRGRLGVDAHRRGIHPDGGGFLADLQVEVNRGIVGNPDIHLLLGGIETFGFDFH